MNKRNLELVFQHYMDHFDEINNPVHMEYYKWQICKEFPVLMNKALAASDDDFAAALKTVRKCTDNIIDSYTQPLSGMVELARLDPARVRSILVNLYAEDGGDLKVQMEKIEAFFKEYNNLLKDNGFEDSFRFKQNSHSVSALLFLMDPENHYMYKATQSQEFAACVEFYDEWGSGDIINLKKYYGLCDALVEEINKNEELLKLNERRFNGDFNVSRESMHPDVNKHILAFDIMYCCSVYDLYEGIPYQKRNAKEKKVYLAEKEKAERLKGEFDQAKEQMDILDEAREVIVSLITPGDELTHKKFGVGTVVSINESQIVIRFPEKEMKMGLATTFANGILQSDKDELNSVLPKYKDVLKRYDAIPKRLESAVRLLAPYEEYLE